MTISTLMVTPGDVNSVLDLLPLLNLSIAEAKDPAARDFGRLRPPPSAAQLGRMSR